MCVWKNQNFKIHVLRKSLLKLPKIFTGRREVPTEVISEV